MSKLLNTNLLGITLKNPVIAASGTFGYGEEYENIINPNALGGICSKGLTLSGSSGNNGTRIWETPSGMLNSIGLENIGVEQFIATKNAKMRSYDTALIVNLGGHSLSDYVVGAQKLNSAKLDILELNISCPNLSCGGMSFGADPLLCAQVVSEVKKVTRFPLMVKLTPNVTDIVAFAKICEDNGADAVSLVNTFLGMAIDVNARKKVFNNTYAGLSGPAIMPIALRMVHQVTQAVNIPVVGMGGITNCKDALSFIMAGATAIQIGSATFSNPNVMSNIINGLEQYCIENKLENISQIRGII